MEGEGSYTCDIENLKATELRLGLPGTCEPRKSAVKATATRGNKRTLSEAGEEFRSGNKASPDDESKEASPSPAKAQVVGWPPIRAYRRNSFIARKAEAEEAVASLYVKVSMDGAPYLRKIDLKVYMSYQDLREALVEMFKCFSLGELSGVEGHNGSDYAVTYEDKDGDWMLVGDVPWEMFISTCKRLRIMRGSEARGLGSNL